MRLGWMERIRRADAANINIFTRRMTDKIIGIMGAMQEEIAGIVSLLEGKKEISRGMRTYYEGLLNGIPTVVVFSRWGKVAATTTVSTLILEFNISELIFTGVAGAVHDDLKIGDIVIGSRLIQHDMDARPIMPRFEIPLLGRTYFESPAGQLAVSIKAANELLKAFELHRVLSETELGNFNIVSPKLFVGEIASGDKFFSATEDKRMLVKNLPEVLCVEMEGAAVAQVCYEYDIPFSIIRTISDTAGDASHIDFQLFIKNISSVYSVELIKNIYGQLTA
jgi:adenosylhomocysteine nucleosidase